VNCAVGMGSGVIEIGSRSQKFIGWGEYVDTQAGSTSHKPTLRT
jgi:hypothetical protein